MLLLYSTWRRNEEGEIVYYQAKCAKEAFLITRYKS